MTETSSPPPICSLFSPELVVGEFSTMGLRVISTYLSFSFVPSLLSLESKHRSNSVLNKTTQGRPISYKESQYLNDSAWLTCSAYLGLLKEKYTLFSMLYYIESFHYRRLPPTSALLIYIIVHFSQQYFKFLCRSLPCQSRYFFS